MLDGRRLQRYPDSARVVFGLYVQGRPIFAWVFLPHSFVFVILAVLDGRCLRLYPDSAR